MFLAGLRVPKVSGSTVKYYTSDALGSTRLVTDSHASTVFADDYLAYGQDNGTPTGSETYKFTGKPVGCVLYTDTRLTHAGGWSPCWHDMTAVDVP